MRLFIATLALAVLSSATTNIVLPPNAGTDKIYQATRTAVRHEEGDGLSGSAFLRLPDTALWDDDYASDADWDKYVHKGGALICALLGSYQTAGWQLKDTRTPPSAASIWSGDLKQPLYDWYWREMNPSSKGCHLAGWEFGDMLKALGLSERVKSKGGDNQCFRIEHWDAGKEDEGGKQVPAINQWYKVGGTDYRATRAHYEFIVDTKGGAIYCTFLESPRSSASREWYGNKKDPELALLPSLRLLSDVLWGYWVRDNFNVKNIRYFFMLGISNDLTNQIIASCLSKAGNKLGEWPGVEFGTETDEGHALLGSPNGAAFAYFLLQHKAQLGTKTITKVTVVRPENDDDIDFVDASLVFHVADAPDPPPDEGQAEGFGVLKEKRHDSHTVEMVEQGKKNMMRVHTFGV